MGCPNKRCVLFLPAATKLGEGYIFTGVCLSTEGRVSASAHAGIPPSPDQAPPLGPDPPGPGSPPDQAPPPGKRTPAYGLQAAGTHPTGMHSCYNFLVTYLIFYNINKLFS